MMKAVALALLLGSTTAAYAADQQASDKEPKKERKICRIDPDSTSHMTKRICKTAAEWKKEQDGTSSQADLRTGFHK